MTSSEKTPHANGPLLTWLVLTVTLGVGVSIFCLEKTKSYPASLLIGSTLGVTAAWYLTGLLMIFDRRVRSAGETLNEANHSRAGEAEKTERSMRWRSTDD